MRHNSSRIANQIHRKLGPHDDCSAPYYPPPCEIFQIRTDVNQFPYRRFFRGRAFDETPRVWEREAGWSPLQEERGEQPSTTSPSSLLMAPANAYFQVPCSTQFPQFETLPRFSDGRITATQKKKDTCSSCSFPRPPPPPSSDTTNEKGFASNNYGCVFSSP